MHEPLILPGEYLRFKIEYKKSGIEYYVVCLVNGIEVSYPLGADDFEELSEMDSRSLKLEIEKQYTKLQQRNEPLKM